MKGDNIHKQNIESQNILAELRKTEILLKEKLEKIHKDQELYNQEHERINEEYEKKKNQISGFLNKDEEKKGFSSDRIHEKCLKIMDHYLTNITDSQLKFKVEFIKEPLAIGYNSSKTFKNLKSEIKNNFDKKENEFFLADENGMIFLDELNVRKSLFPLQYVQISNYEPVVRVIFKKSSGEELIKNKNEKIEADKEDEESEIKKIQTPKKTYGVKIFEIFSLLLYITLVCLWISSAIFLRNLRDYQAILEAFKSILTPVRVPYKELNEMITESAAFVLNFPTPGELSQGLVYESSRKTLYNQFNRHLGKSRLVQSRRVKIEDYIHRVNVTDASCYWYYNYYDWIVGNRTYKFYADPNSKPIMGQFASYDNSGFFFDLNTQDPVEFYKELNMLRESNWIDEDTMMLMVIILFYDINNDLFVIFRRMFERTGPAFYSFDDFSLIDLNPDEDPYTLTILIMCSIYLVCMVIQLRLKKKEEKTPSKSGNTSCIKKLLCCPCIACRWIWRKLHVPDFFEVIAMFNIFFTYFCIAMRYKYSYVLTPAAVVKFDQFNDIQYYASQYELLSYLYCANILFYLLCIVNEVSNFFDDFKLIISSILRYVNNIYSFTFVWVFSFTGISMIIAYELFGSFALFYYRDLKFTYLKIIAAFFRGTVDNVDYDLAMSRTSTGKGEGIDTMIGEAQNSFLNLVTHTGRVGFYIFSVIFFFIANFIIRLTYMAYFVVAYKNAYEEDLQKKEIEKRKIWLKRKNEMKNLLLKKNL